MFLFNNLYYILWEESKELYTIDFHFSMNKCIYFFYNKL